MKSILVRNHWHETSDEMSIKKREVEKIYNFMNATMFLMMVFIKGEKKRNCSEDGKKMKGNQVDAVWREAQFCTKESGILQLKLQKWNGDYYKRAQISFVLHIELHESCQFNYSVVKRTSNLRREEKTTLCVSRTGGFVNLARKLWMKTCSSSYNHGFLIIIMLCHD